MTHFLMVFAGLILLFLGGEGLVRGSVALARSLGVSRLLVSAVIIGFGTSMPELVVSLGAALKGSTEIALGNAIGSNIVNILLIVPAGALLYPIHLKHTPVKNEVYMMLFSTVLLGIMIYFNKLNFLTGLLLVVVLVIYLTWSYFKDRAQERKISKDLVEEISFEHILTPSMALIYTVVGLLALSFGASILVDGAVEIARGYHISEDIIGLTLVAVGTSLPELATVISAALKKHSDVVIGNILGSSIFNILAILGITSMVKPIPITPQVMDFDLWVLLYATFLFGGALLLKNIGRLLSTLMAFSYVAYILWLYV